MSVADERTVDAPPSRPSSRELEGVADPAGFGAALRRVRAQRGLTLRGMEQYLRGLTDRPLDRSSKSKIEQAEKGQALEERWVLRYLSAAGVPGPELPPWVMALRRALDEDAPTAGGALWAADATPDTVESPFPGLRPFGAEQHRVFFGRGREVGELAGTLDGPAERPERAAAVLLVVGPSGCGKSSLVRAGLAPTMAAAPDWWTLAPFWPGSEPITALARELCAAARPLGLDWTLPEVRRRLDDDDGDGLRELAEELLLAAPAPRRTRLLVVVDQFEELLTHASPPHRARFVRLLAGAAAGPVAVVATMSPQFLEALLAAPELTGLTTRLVAVRPLEREALTVVIEQPARVAGIEVEPELVARLVADTAGGDALPLLAYTLAQLAEGVGHGGRLESARYDRLGGVHGTLARQADRALDDAVAGGRGRDDVIGSLLRLVTVDENGHPARWRVARDRLPADVVTDLGPFLARRLLTADTDRDTGGGVVVQVAHEAFLSAWAPLEGAIAANSAALRARRGIEQAAAVWDAADRAPERLFERGQLAAALADTGAHQHATRYLGPRTPVTERVALSPPAREFLGASIRRDRRRRGRAVTVLTLLLVIALAAAGVAAVQLGAAREQQRLATARQLLSEADADRDSDPRTALLLGETAAHLAPSGETRAGLLRVLLANRYRATLAEHTNIVRSAAFSPDGRILATASDDGTVVLWDLRATAPRPGPVLRGHIGSVKALAFTPDGHTLATGGDDGGVLWDLTDSAAPRPGPVLRGHTDTVDALAFSPDGRALATGSEDHTVILWDLTNPAAPRPAPTLRAHTETVRSLAFAPDGRTLASISQDRTTVLWDVTDRAAPRRGPTLPLAGLGTAVAFSPSGRTLATGGADNNVTLWDLGNPAAPTPGPVLRGHANTVSSLAFSPDGRTLVTGSFDRTAIAWDLADPAQPRPSPPLAGHTKEVTSVAFAPDGHTLATTSADDTAIVWDLTAPARPRRGPVLAAGTGPVNGAAYSPDGRTLAAATEKTGVAWDLTDPARPRRASVLAGQTDTVKSVAFSPDGHTVATTSSDDTTVLWDLSDPAAPRRGPVLANGTRGAAGVAFSPGGRTLAVGSGNNGTVVLWDLGNPAAPRRGAVLPGHLNGVFSVTFSPDGHVLAAGSGVDAGNVILWDVTDPDAPRRDAILTGQTSGVYAVAFSPDGRTLASGSRDGSTVLTDVTDPARPVQGPILHGHTKAVFAVAFSPDGRTLATGSSDDTTVLWDLTDPAAPRQAPPLAGHTDTVNTVTFSPDGRTLATGSADGTAILWDLTGYDDVVNHAAQRACAITRGGMTPADWARFVPDLGYEDACAPE